MSTIRKADGIFFLSQILKTDDTMIPVRPADGRRFTLGELQALVGGDVEFLRTNTGENTVLVVRDEGRLQNLPPNARATALFFYGEHVEIVGDALVCDREMIE